MNRGVNRSTDGHILNLGRLPADLWVGARQGLLSCQGHFNNLLLSTCYINHVCFVFIHSWSVGLTPMMCDMSATTDAADKHLSQIWAAHG